MSKKFRQITIPGYPQHKHHKDVLKQLLHENGVWVRIHLLEECFMSIKQTLTDATTEIERLRAENKQLKKNKNDKTRKN